MSEEINHSRRRFLGTAAMAIAAAQLGMSGFVRAQSSKTPAADRLTIEGKLPSIGGASE
jgi:nitrous oxide reductase